MRELDRVQGYFLCGAAGAALGRRAIPGKYLEGPELKGLLLTMAGDLYAGVPAEAEETWSRKYAERIYE